ncbi:TetR family transcriptional regulator [Pseudomonas moraviensis]|uniref:TetR family transcriptional regulator n=1 Tax=Pseudomonas moraviensis TaxID=321662 RepID=UPI00215ECCB8|nr:TetR family transcriptional regulator [Pseudomonas moraviensis]UVL45055.1 TetR family transcriptional regulator [Pseudomonas moraviensis]
MKPRKISSNYKPAEDRERDLRLALSRIQKGRAHSKETKVSISAVAREAGVSTALIHNYYPNIVEAVRAAQGHSNSKKRNTMLLELNDERKKAEDYRSEIGKLRKQIASLASINEVLIAENRALKQKMKGAQTINLIHEIKNS